MKSHLRKRSARNALTALVSAKDRLHERWQKLPYAREAEFQAVLSLVDELIDAVLDDRDLSDSRAKAILSAVDAFRRSTFVPARAHDQEGDD